MPTNSMHLSEFDYQVRSLVNKGYPQAAGLSESAFTKIMEPLKQYLADLPESRIELSAGKLPFTIVVKSSLVPLPFMLSKIVRDGKNAVEKLKPHSHADYRTIEGLRLPSTPIYLLVDVDRGVESLNLTPNSALKIINSAHRSPLTIDEGISLVTHYPDFLIKNNCFSLLASRIPDNKTIPAIWINGEKHPNLGWCWAGNPHTWLGSASCGQRFPKN